VQYAGAAPGVIAGIMQVNLQIPANLIQTFSPGPVAVPVVITVGVVASQPNVTISVAP
jgi:uncharacterized protein (TIGR03437 family)